MIDFVDKTDEQNGTPINRNNLMAMQGFENRELIISGDGVLTELNTNGEKLILTFGNSVEEKFIGEKTITKTTSIFSNGAGKEILS